MMASQTLLFLVTEDWYFASHRLPLARAAVREGFRVKVAARVQRHENSIRDAGCEIIPLRWRRSGNGPGAHLRAIAELVSVYRAERPAIVHHVALKPIVFGSIAARVAGVPAIVNAVAGFGSLGGAKGWRAHVTRTALNVALRALLDGGRSRVIVQNPEDRDTLIRRGFAEPARIALIRGAGVDLRAFTPGPRMGAPPKVVLCARMLRSKGIEEFVYAANQLRAESVAARFILVGDRDADNFDSIPREQLRTWHESGIVEWRGFVSDMPAVLSGADIACLPSHGEGLPKALLEAAAAGLPIVATNVPGCREIVRHGDNGFLVPPRDRRALTDALRELIRHECLRRDMGERSRAIAEAEFSDETVADATLTVYRELLSTASRGDS